MCHSLVIIYAFHFGIKRFSSNRTLAEITFLIISTYNTTSHRFARTITTPPPPSTKMRHVKSEIVSSSGCKGCLLINKIDRKIHWVGVILSSLFSFLFLVRFGGILGEFGHVLARRSWAKTPMARPNELDIYATEANQKGAIRYLLYPNSVKWAWYRSHTWSVTWYRRISGR